MQPKSSSSTGEQDEEGMTGGKSDASFQRRQLFQNLLAAGISADLDMADGSQNKSNNNLDLNKTKNQGQII